MLTDASSHESDPICQPDLDFHLYPDILPNVTFALGVLWSSPGSRCQRQSLDWPRRFWKGREKPKVFLKDCHWMAGWFLTMTITKILLVLKFGIHGLEKSKQEVGRTLGMRKTRETLSAP